MTAAVKGHFHMGHWAGLKLDDKPQVVVVGTLDLNGKGKPEKVFGVMNLMGCT